jgi:hypothetical protein
MSSVSGCKDRGSMMLSKPIAERDDSWWYPDLVHVQRCRMCLRAESESHGATCPLGQVIALVAALIESDAAMGLEDTDRVLALAEIVGVPTVGPECD